MSEEKMIEQIFIDIISQFMKLEVDQSWVRNQDRKVPNKDGLFVVCGVVDSLPRGTGTEIVTRTITPPGGADPYDEVVEVVTYFALENIQIDIFSKDDQARKRRYEILAAFNSIYSKQKQDAGFFKIALLPRSFVNSTVTEGGSNMNKFSCVLAASTSYTVEKVLSSTGGAYYDEFRTRVDDEETIGTANGIIEFSIDEDSDEPLEGE